MATTMSDINKALAGFNIKVRNLRLQLDKAKDKTAVEQLADEVIQQAKNVVKTKGYDESTLEQIIGRLGDAERSVAYDPTEANKKAAELFMDGKFAEADKVEGVRDARIELERRIREAKDHYSKQAKVMEIYGPRFQTEELEDRLGSSVKANERKIEANQKKIDAIKDFEAGIAVHVETIKKGIELQEDLEKLEEIINKIEKAEAAIAIATGLTKSTLEANKASDEAQLKTEAQAIASKHKITIDCTSKDTIKTSVSTEKGKIDLSPAVDGIKAAAKNSSDEYIKNEIYKAIETESDAKKIRELINEKKSQLNAEKGDLKSINKSLSQTIGVFELGRTTLGTYSHGTPVLPDPTDAQIDDVLRTDRKAIKSSITALALNEEQKQNEVYKWLCAQKQAECASKGKTFNPNKKHPILMWQAGFKGNIAKWEESLIRAEAQKRAKAKIKSDAENTTEAKSAKRVQERTAKLREKFFGHVSKATDAELDEMLNDAGKGKFGKGMEATYAEAEAEEYGQSL